MKKDGIPAGLFLLDLANGSVQIIIGEREPTEIPSEDSELLRFPASKGEGLRPFGSVRGKVGRVFCITSKSEVMVLLGIGLALLSRGCQSLKDLERNIGIHPIEVAGSSTSSGSGICRACNGWGE